MRAGIFRCNSGHMLRVATWNVNSIRSRLQRLEAFLKRHQPDVVCLQELKCTEVDFPADAVRSFGYQALILGQKTYNGVALLSRRPMHLVASSLGVRLSDDEAEQARFLLAELDGVHIGSAYVPNGRSVGSAHYEYKLRWLEALRGFIKSKFSPRDAVILGGDFNVAPEDRDCYDPEAWRGQVLFSEPEKQALRSLQECGFQDLFRKQTSEAGQYSWWDYRQAAFRRGMGLRIDLILGTAPVAQDFKHAWIDREERAGDSPSDHAPVLVDLSRADSSSSNA